MISIFLELIKDIFRINPLIFRLREEVMLIQKEGHPLVGREPGFQIVDLHSGEIVEVPLHGPFACLEVEKLGQAEVDNTVT